MGSSIADIIFQNVSILNFIILLISTLLFIGSYKNRKRVTHNNSYLIKGDYNSNSTTIENKGEKEQVELKKEQLQEQEIEKKEINNNNNNNKNNNSGSLIELNLNSNPISSDEESSSSSPLLNSKSFLSPLNFTTGKKIKPHSKKKQSYYVSTYYSSCQAPDQSAIMDETEEDNSNSSPELLYKRDLEKNTTIISKGSGEKEDREVKLLEVPSPMNINDTTTTTTTSISKTNSQPATASDSINFMTHENNTHLINDLTKANLFFEPDHRSHGGAKKLKKRKCILPQVLELRWRVQPKKVLIIKKYNDEMINDLAPKLVEWLESINITVIKESDDICGNPNLENLSEISDPYSIDFIISLGGDGTILHTSSLFKTYIPPILSFSLGSLGFLTAFDYHRHREYIQSVIDGKCFVSYRLRLSCTVISGNTKKNYQVLNEVSIDRGTNPYLSNLECSCDDKLITIVQADGLIIATSTGSTAYSLSAGGSLVHPTIPAVLITPICPHTLSFRPVILPSTSTLTIRVPEISRCSAWASFDGKSRQELKQGDRVIIKTSKWAVPVVCKTNESCEWFEKLADNLNWNVRMIQKSLKSSMSYE